MVKVVWILPDKELIPQLVPAMNPATKLIIYYTGKKKDANGKRVQLELSKEDLHKVAFFDPPEMSTSNPVARLERSKGATAEGTLQQSGARSSETFSDWKEDRHIDVRLGRPNSDDWESILRENFTELDADNCVAISANINVNKAVDSVCQKLGIPTVRVDQIKTHPPTCTWPWK